MITTKEIKSVEKAAAEAEKITRAAVRALVEKRVDRGIKFLTKTVGKDWYKKINMSSLTLSSASSCITGQAFGHFETYLEKYPKEVPEDNGFDVIANDKDFYDTEFGEEVNEMFGNYDLLQEVWLEKLKQIKKANRAK